MINRINFSKAIIGLVLLAITLNSGLALNDKKPVTKEQITLDSQTYQLTAEDFTKFKEQLKIQAQQLGFNDNSLKVIDSLRLNTKVVEKDQAQVELRNRPKDPNDPKPQLKYSINTYINTHISDLRISRAAKMYQRNFQELNEIATKYKVSPEAILGLWALESNFGATQGNYDALDALSSLAFEGRRRELFTLEFFNALKVMEINKLNKDQFKSSWAGALGQTQFMPSSYLLYGADANENGKIDIWQENPDVWGSIANYLANEGWNDSYKTVAQVNLPETTTNFSELVGSKNKRPLKEWQELGVKLVNNNDLVNQFANNPNIELFLVLPDRDLTPAYLVTSNYLVYLKWNRSSYFAITNGIFAAAVKAQAALK